MPESSSDRPHATAKSEFFNGLERFGEFALQVSVCAGETNPSLVPMAFLSLFARCSACVPSWHPYRDGGVRCPSAPARMWATYSPSGWLASASSPFPLVTFLGRAYCPRQATGQARRPRDNIRKSTERREPWIVEGSKERLHQLQQDQSSLMELYAEMARTPRALLPRGPVAAKRDCPPVRHEIASRPALAQDNNDKDRVGFPVRRRPETN